jgi:CRP-like cAMP-binding protein/ribonuclease BN (tRNA processing enzyme)
MPVKEIMPGCKIFMPYSHKKRTAKAILFGQPAEVLKVLEAMGEEVPEVMVLPSIFYNYGILQAGIEFLLYHFLFQKQGYFQGRKLVIIGNSDQNKRMKKILQLTLLGPTREKMKKWGIDSEDIEQQVRLSKNFSLPKLGSKTELATIDDMVEFINFKHKKAALGNVEIEIVDRNIFKVNCKHEKARNIFEAGCKDATTLIDIDISKPQDPPLPMPMLAELVSRPILGATALSPCTTGFDKKGYTSGLVFWLNRMGISVDGVSWMKKHLLALGINPYEIVAHIVTHIHDDHSNILDLIVNGQQFYLISDKLGFHCLVEKVSLILDVIPESVEDMIQLVKVKIGQPLYWYGAKFEFWRTAHTVPTLGFRVTLNGESMVYSGDTVWGEKLDKLLRDGIISQEFYEKIQKIPFLKSAVTFFDAGGGMIHPNIKDIAALPEQIRGRIVPTHIPEIPEEYRSIFQAIEPGQSWVVIGENLMTASDFLSVMDSPLFVGISKMWRNVIASQGKIITYPRNCKIIEEGGPGKRFYVIVGGTVSVQIGGTEVAKLSTGDFFGDRSLLENQPCNATIMAETQVKVVSLPSDIFKEMADGTRLSAVLGAIYKIRPVLMKISLFASLPTTVQNSIAACAEAVNFKAGDAIIRQGEDPDFLYIIKDGTADVTVLKNGGQSQEKIATLGSGQVFGEIALLIGGKRTANVIALTDMEVLRISKEQFQCIAGSTPMLMFSLGKMANDRKGKLAK